MSEASVRERIMLESAKGFTSWLRGENEHSRRLNGTHPIILRGVLNWTRAALISFAKVPDFSEIEAVVGALFRREGIIIFHLREAVAAALEYCAFELGLNECGLRSKRRELLLWLTTADVYARIPPERLERALTYLLEELEASFYQDKECDLHSLHARLVRMGLCLPEETWPGWLVDDTLAFLDNEGFLQNTGY